MARVAGSPPLLRAFLQEMPKGADLHSHLSGAAFRLIGIGAASLVPIAEADPADLADPDAPRRVAAQAAIDQLRTRFGDAAITRGRSLR